MRARLTNAAARRKILALASAASLCAATAAGPQRERQDLRDCVAAARDSHSVAACEQSQQAVLRDRIRRWSEALRSRLDAHQRAAFDRNARAWQAFYDSEVTMLDATLPRRADGLGPALRPGAVTRLLEERERQLREHLHNVSYGNPLPGRPGR
ncbi:MAG: hypothetical protein KDJ39_12720 [Gammaproteobacteria bacterium]|nr:hypothetical protein [Gammaproteobacteria bacterium]MCP5299917.1 hypothetical protein [Chromatiaceae bacterium]